MNAFVDSHPDISTAAREIWAAPLPSMPRIRGRLDTLNDRVCQLSTSERRRQSLSDSRLMMFISIKNRRFSKPLVDWFVCLAEKLGTEALVCPVDEPYIYNRQAELGTDTLDAADRDRIYTHAEEFARMTEKVLRRRGESGRTRLVSWTELSAETPAWMKQEILDGYARDGGFRRTVRQLVLDTRNPQDDAAVDRFSQFLLCELPVLLNSYYGDPVGAADFYPGPNPELFWMIESGMFERDLPRITALIRSAEPLLYVDAHPPLASPAA